MRSEPATWGSLMERLSGATLAYLRAQVAAGADAIQLFDSWVGDLSPEAYRAHVLPWSQRILQGLRETGVPRIHFGVGTGELLSDLASAGADVVGVDWRVPLDRARERLQDEAAVQGNLDPAALLAPFEVVEEQAIEVLRRGGGRAHVFNLGHGVLPGTPHETLERLVDLVHSWDPATTTRGSGDA